MNNIWALNDELIRPQIRKTPVLPSSVAKRLDNEWELAKRDSPWLHDGFLFSLERPLGRQPIDQSSSFNGFFIPYRYWVACQRLPDLANQRLFNPLAVSGLCMVESGMIFGRRSERVLHDKGVWELVPSGGVGKKCILKETVLAPEVQILLELEEEIGIKRANVTSFRVCAAMVGDFGLVDLFYRLETRGTVASAMETFKSNSHEEYSELCWVDLKDLPQFLLKEAAAFSPVSATVLKFLGLVKWMP